VYNFSYQNSSFLSVATKAKSIMFGNHQQTIDRRTFIGTSLLPTVAPLATALLQPTSTVEAQQPATPPTPEIIDCNVHLFDWPFRKLKYAKTDALIAKLRKHRITTAWAGNFEAVLNKQLDQSNRRLAEECRSHGNGSPGLLRCGS